MAKRATVPEQILPAAAADMLRASQLDSMGRAIDNARVKAQAKRLEANELDRWANEIEAKRQELQASSFDEMVDLAKLAARPAGEGER